MPAEFVAGRTAGHALARGLLPPPSCRAAGLAFRSSRISQHPVCRAGNSQGWGCLGGACSWQFLFVSCQAWGSTSALRRRGCKAGGGTGPGSAPVSQGLECLHSIVLPARAVGYAVPEPRPYVLCSLFLSLFNGEAPLAPAC